METLRGLGDVVDGADRGAAPLDRRGLEPAISSQCLRCDMDDTTRIILR
jgi:hypothetical protein